MEAAAIEGDGMQHALVEILKQMQLKLATDPLVSQSVPPTTDDAVNTLLVHSEKNLYSPSLDAAQPDSHHARANDSGDEVLMQEPIPPPSDPIDLGEPNQEITLGGTSHAQVDDSHPADDVDAFLFSIEQPIQQPLIQEDHQLHPTNNNNSLDQFNPPHSSSQRKSIRLAKKSRS
jgi:hypothetical protein